MTMFTRFAGLGRLLACLALALPLIPFDAHAGCGCDHPPPAFAPVMPPFGWSGTTLQITVEDAAFRAGKSYPVSFRSRNSFFPIPKEGVAQSADTLRVQVPAGLFSGPVEIRVTDRNREVVLDDELFTAMGLPRRLPAGDSILLLKDFAGAVSADGVLYIPIDLRDVFDPTQFAFVLSGVPLTFKSDDVIFYNRDGFDLTLFSLAVDDPTEREWGSYFGWDVEQDSGIVGTVYDTKVEESFDPASSSDLLTYWRHEFRTYANAHLSGGSHEVDENGFHADGSLHVDHDLLVIAIEGKVNGDEPKPGALWFDLLAASVVSENPVEPEVMVERASSAEAYLQESSGLDAYFSALTGETDSITLDSEDITSDSSLDTLDATADSTTPTTDTSTSKKGGGKGKRK